MNDNEKVKGIKYEKEAEISFSKILLKFHF